MKRTYTRVAPEWAKNFKGTHLFLYIQTPFDPPRLFPLLRSWILQWKRATQTPKRCRLHSHLVADFTLPTNNSSVTTSKTRTAPFLTTPMTSTAMIWLRSWICTITSRLIYLRMRAMRMVIKRGRDTGIVIRRSKLGFRGGRQKEGFGG